MDTCLMSAKSDAKTRINKANAKLKSKFVAMSSLWVKTSTLTHQSPEGQKCFASKKESSDALLKPKKPLSKS